MSYHDTGIPAMQHLKFTPHINKIAQERIRFSRVAGVGCNPILTKHEWNFRTIMLVWVGIILKRMHPLINSCFLFRSTTWIAYTP